MTALSERAAENVAVRRRFPWSFFGPVLTITAMIAWSLVVDPTDLIVLAILFGLPVGSWAASEWELLLEWRRGRPVGTQST